MGSMPLITNLLLPVEQVRHLPPAENVDAAVQAVYEKQYRHFQHAPEVDMNNGSLLKMARPESDVQVPAVPPRSSLRASQVLHSLVIEFPQGKVITNDDSHPQAVEDDPHALYLSSEEEMSVNADDYDDSFVELDSERASSRGSSQCSHEDIARVVSFMFVGKPQLVEVSRSRPSSFKRRSTDLSMRSRRRPSPLRPPWSDTRSSTPSSLRSDILPPSATSFFRSQNPFALDFSISLATNLPSSHSFLKSDPFPAPSAQEIDMSPRLIETRPKTPTAIASAALKGGLRGVSRTLSLSRKKPNIAKLNIAMASTSVLQEDSSPNPSISTSVATPLSTTSPATPQETRNQGPVYYNDIVRNAIKAPPPPSPTPTSEARLRSTKFLFGMSKRTMMLKAG